MSIRRLDTSSQQRKRGRSFVFLQAALFMLLVASVMTVARWDSPLEAQVKPSLSLEQCANLGITCDTTHAAQWQTGNLGSSNSDYLEGDSIPYRSVVDNLTVGQTYKVQIEWDSTASGHHAIDYITSFGRTETTADPCAGITCSASVATLAIPLDPRVSSAGVTQLPSQVITAYGATFPAAGASVPNSGNLCGTATCSIPANPSAYGFDGTYESSSQTGTSVYFTASSTRVVLAWGGHIASRTDWGNGKSAAAISGSPYHMRIIDFACSNVNNCSSGNMDRSLSSAAVTLPSSITIVKQATPEGATGFSFTGSPAPLTSFVLTDDGTAANTRVFSGITAFGDYTVSETLPSGWSLDRIDCEIANRSTGSTTVNANAVGITLGEGEDVTCTFLNSPTPAPALSLTKTADIENYSGAGQLITYTYVIRNTGNVPIGPAQFRVDDDKINEGAPFACGPAGTTLAVDATVQCTAVYTTQTGDIGGVVTNTAFALVGEVVSESRQVTVPYVATTTTTTIPAAPALSLTKTADIENYSGAGQLITYTYVIRNTGNVPIGPAQFRVDDDKINEGAPFACGPAGTTLAVDATVQCTAVYTTQTGDIGGVVTNTAFALVGEVVSESRQVTVPYVATTTTLAPTTTTIAPTTTTLAPTTTTIPAATTTVPAATTTVPAATTTVPAGIQVVIPEGTPDVVGPTTLPETGLRVGLISIIAGIVLLGGLASMTITSNRRTQRRTGGK